MIGMAGYPQPVPAPDHCDHVALYYRDMQVACWRGSLSRAARAHADRAWRYEERSHHGLLIDRDQIPARWPADAFDDPAPAFPYPSMIREVAA